jgi:hypothetical protein
MHQRLPHAVIVVQALPALELVELTRAVRAADVEITDFEDEASPAIYADAAMCRSLTPGLMVTLALT